MLKQYTFLISSLLVAVATLQASSLSSLFSGSFNTGDLSGEPIFGSYEIETFGEASGTAVEIDFLTTEGLFNEFAISFFSGAEFYEFNLDSDASAEATFANGQVVGFDFFGIDGIGNTLEFNYDAYQSTAEAAVTMVFTDAFTLNQSSGTADLAFGVVPEPSSYALIFGAVAMSCGVFQRRRRI